MGVVNKSVEKGIGDSGVAYDLMPVLDGELARHDGRCRAVPVLDHFQEVLPFLVGESCETQIIK